MKMQDTQSRRISSQMASLFTIRPAGWLREIPSSWLAAGLTVGFVLLLYGVWLPHEYSGDDLQYATVIQQSLEGRVLFHPVGETNFRAGPGDEPSSTTAPGVPVNPRYLLEWPTSVAVANGWQLFGWDGDVIKPILVLRLVVGALGIFFFFLAIHVLSVDTLSATLASVGLATTLGYWTYSTHLDQTINMIALLCIAFYLIALRVNDPGQTRIVPMLALTLAAATLYNFTALIPSLVFGIAAAALTTSGERYRRIKEFARFSAIYGVILVTGLALGVAIWESPGALVSSEYWRSARFSGHPEYNVDVIRDTLRSAFGFSKSQITYPGVPGSLQEHWDSVGRAGRLQVAGYYGVILGLMSVPFALGIWKRDQLKVRPIVWVMFSSLLIAYSLFNWWWDPGYIKYWLIPLMCWWALVSILLGNLKEMPGRLYAVTATVLAVFIVATFALNAATIFRPQADEDANEWLIVAQKLKESEPDALFISAGSHPLDFLISFFTRRDIVSSGLVLYSRGSTDHQFVSNVISSRVDRYRADGAPVYVYGLESLSSDDRRQFSSFLDDNELRIAWVFHDLTIYEVMFDQDAQTGRGE